MLKEYGLKNKKEVWKARSMLKKITSQAKKLSGERSEQAKKESEQLLMRLVRLGLLKSGGQLGDALSIPFEEVLNRRLQTLVHKKGLARTMNQARQFVVHGHITVNNKMVDVPSYLVNVEEQHAIGYVPRSALANSEHPERIDVKKELAKKGEEKEVLEQKEEKREKHGKGREFVKGRKEFMKGKQGSRKDSRKAKK